MTELIESSQVQILTTKDANIEELITTSNDVN